MQREDERDDRIIRIAFLPSSAVMGLRPDALEGLPADALQRVQEAIGAAEEEARRANVQAGGWVGKVVGEAVGLDPEDPFSKEQIKALIREWKIAGYLVEYADKDGHRKPRKFIKNKMRPG